MFCKLCGKISAGSRCIYCGTALKGEHSAEGGGQNEEKANAVQPTVAAVAPNTYGTPYYSGAYASEPTENSSANRICITSFVMSLFWLLSVVGLILGIVGLKKVNNSAGVGKGFAIAGIVLSIINIVVQHFI